MWLVIKFVPSNMCAHMTSRYQSKKSNVIPVYCHKHQTRAISLDFFFAISCTFFYVPSSKVETRRKLFDEDNEFFNNTVTLLTRNEHSRCFFFFRKVLECWKNLLPRDVRRIANASHDDRVFVASQLSLVILPPLASDAQRVRIKKAEKKREKKRGDNALTLTRTETFP